MQPAKRLQKLQAVGGPAGVGGDTGISFYSGQSSFMDASSMMETSGIGYAKHQMKMQEMGVAKKATAAPPKPPSDKLIHVSQCRNDKCPLQHIWKQQQYGLNPQDKNSKEFDQQFIPHYSCPKCLDDPPKYCSQRCFQQDWFKLHQYECSGQNPESRDSVLLSECQRIEASTPFIKDGYDESSLTPEQIKLESIFQNIAKKDLEFIQSRDANLGKGSYGEVQLAKHRATGVMVAVKKIEKRSLTSSKIKETLIREIRIQKQLNHEYICRLYTSFEDKETIYLALEYASKGNLFYLIRKEKYLSEDTAFYFFIQVCSGIYYMHKQGLIHRDIKPENILIKEGNIIKICDFGWCVQSDANQQRNTFCGTLEYMAPEMIQNKAHNHTLDIWSLGILLYELVHGRAPFTGVHPREIQEKIMRGTIRFKPGLSSEYKDLVHAILKYDTTERLPLIKVFDHPWVRNFEKKYNLSKNVAATAAARQREKEKEQETKKAQRAAEAKALAEAAEKQRQAEQEAAEKERQRQEAIKLQQQEQEMLRKQKRQEEKKREQEEMLLYQALQEAEKQYNKQQEEKQQEEKPQEVDETQNSIKDAQDPDATQVLPVKGNKQQKTASTFISPRLSDKSMKSQREQETEAKKKQMALLAIQQAQLKAQQEQLERELQDSQKDSVKPPKTSERRNLNSSISVRSNKKAMHQQASPQIITEEEPQPSEPERRPQVKGAIKENNYTGEREKEKPASNQQQQSDPSTKNSSKQEKQSVPVSTQQDFDKYESEFQVLDETDMNDEEDDSSSSEVESESDSDDGIPTVPLDKTITPATPNPNETKESPEKEEVAARVSASEEKADESADDDESTGIKEEEPKEDNQDQTSNNEEEAEANGVQESEDEDEDDEDDDSDEDEDDDSDQDDEQEESSDEDERDKRRREREEKKKSIKGMDPIYDSSQDERIKSGLEDSSSEEEAEQSFMQKLGGIFFFGCGGDNNKKDKNTKS